MPAFDALPLTTERLCLRPLTGADAAAMLAIFGDPAVMRYWNTPPWPSFEHAVAWLADDIASMAAGEHLRLGIERRDDAVLVGMCTLFRFDAVSRRAEIGYALGTSAWGRGYMHEALQALLDHGFGALALNRVEADIDPRNAGSARSLERLGFTLEGTLRERWIVDGEVSDTAYYGLLAREWKAGR